MNIEVTADQEYEGMGVAVGGGGVEASRRSVTVKLPIAKDVFVSRRILSLTISIRIFNRNFPFFDRLSVPIRKMEQHAFTLFTQAYCLFFVESLFVASAFSLTPKICINKLVNVYIGSSFPSLLLTNFLGKPSSLYPPLIISENRINFINKYSGLQFTNLWSLNCKHWSLEEQQKLLIHFVGDVNLEHSYKSYSFTVLLRGVKRHCILINWIVSYVT